MDWFVADADADASADADAADDDDEPVVEVDAAVGVEYNLVFGVFTSLLRPMEGVRFIR